MSYPQKNLYKKLFGLKGENLAVKHIKKCGYKLIKRNYVTPFGEADIIAERDGETVFIEVKTRSDVSFGLPREAVDSKKQEKYRKIAEYYALKFGEKPTSFAVAEVMGGEVNLIERAF